MKLYADENAVARCDRSFHEVSVSSGWRGDAGLPWADEVVERIDELAIERLPEHLTEGRRASLEDRRKAPEESDAEPERERQERYDARARVEALSDDLSWLSHSERFQAVVDARTAYGTWNDGVTGVQQRVREVLDAEHVDHAPGESVEDTWRPGRRREQRSGRRGTARRRRLAAVSRRGPSGPARECRARAGARVGGSPRTAPGGPPQTRRSGHAPQPIAPSSLRR
jgi:hypothetical protein